MSYRDKIEKYKKHLLSEEEEKQVKEEIEKMDAISEYLADKLEEEFDFGEEKPNKSPDKSPDESLAKNKPKAFQKTKREEDEFEKYVQKAIRRSFAKMAAVVGAVILAVVLFIQFALSPIMESMYYNPAKQIEILSEDKQSSIIYPQMSMDFNIYSALTHPELGQTNMMAVPLGYGNYSVTMSESVAYGTSRFNSVGGQIRKGKLELYDPNYLKTESLNTFACYGLERGKDYEVQLQKPEMLSLEEYEEEYEEEVTSKGQWRYISLEEGRKALDNLEEDKKYVAYVSLKRDLSFDEMNDLMKRVRGRASYFLGRPWLAVHVEEENRFGFGHMGYPYEDVSSIRTPEIYNEKYPELSIWELDAAGHHDWEKMDEINQDEAIVTQHFISMLNYMSDQKEFVDMMDSRGSSWRRFRSAAKYVEENGLSYYGFVCITTKQDMLAMMEEEEIIGIVPKDWN